MIVVCLDGDVTNVIVLVSSHLTVLDRLSQSLIINLPPSLICLQLSVMTTASQTFLQNDQIIKV